MWHNDWSRYRPMSELSYTKEQFVKRTTLREVVFHSLALKHDKTGSIVPILAVYHDRGTSDVAIVLPRADGDLLQVTPKVSKRELLGMMIESLRTVHRARAVVRPDTPLQEFLGPKSRGTILFLVHGDIKAENFLVFGTKVVLCDFGATFTTPKHMLPIISTLCYSAPERYHARTYEFTGGQWKISQLQSMDMFSLSASLFAYLTNQSYRHLSSNVRKWEDLTVVQRQRFEFCQDCDPDAKYVFEHHFGRRIAVKLLSFLNSIPVMRCKATELEVGNDEI